MEQHELRPPKGAKHTSKRVGRGTGSGTGTSAGRGRKGQRKRGSVRTGFESGHITTMRRLPRKIIVDPDDPGVFVLAQRNRDTGELEPVLRRGARRPVERGSDGFWRLVSG